MVVNLTPVRQVRRPARYLYDMEHGGLLGLYEVFVFTRRPLWFMILGGVFDRHPELKVVVAENGVQWLPSLIRDMEQFFDTHGSVPVRAAFRCGRREYFDRHVLLGGSLMKRFEAEIVMRSASIGSMWGVDYPHLEERHRFTARSCTTSSAVAQSRHPADPRPEAVDLWGFDAPLLQGVADRVGPTVEDLATELPSPEIPPTFSWSLGHPVPMATSAR
jgi:hypothetical protein